MEKNKKLIAAIAIAMIAVSAMGCKMIEKTPEAIQKTVIATVGNESITKGDLDKRLTSYIAQLKQQYGADYESNSKAKDQLKQAKQQMLNGLVTQKVLLQKATELNLKPSDDEINSQIDKQINDFKAQYPEEGKWESALQENGFTEDEYRKLVQDDIIAEAVQKDMVKDVAVTDDDAQAYYDQNKDSKFSTPGDIDYDKSLTDANALKAKIDSGEDFSELAKSNSADTGSKANGGDLGFVEYNSTNMVKEFMDGFKNLKEGEVSQPVKSQFGYHIIKVTGVTDKGANVAHILVTDRKDSKVTPFDQVKDQVKQSLLQQKQQDTFSSTLDQWKKDLKVKTYEDKL